MAPSSGESGWLTGLVYRGLFARLPCVGVVGQPQRRITPGVVGSPATGERGAQTLIDRIREQIEDRLDQLLGEAEKLRKALAALDPPRRASVDQARDELGATPPDRVRAPPTH